jgi:hypothetical protein
MFGAWSVVSSQNEHAVLRVIAAVGSGVRLSYVRIAECMNLCIP